MILPKTMKTYCSGANCKTHQEHSVTQYKSCAPRDEAQGKRRYDGKQAGFGGQTRPIFRKKAKTTKKILLKLTCQSCKQTHQVQIKRCKHFDIGMNKKK